MKVDVKQDGSSLIITPPPPPLSQICFFLNHIVAYSTNHVYLHRPNAFGFWQTRLHLCYETLKRVSNFSELA